MRLDRVTLHFEGHVGQLRSADGEALRGFSLAGADRVFHWAEATPRGDSIVVTCDAVPAPVAVRYAWADNPDCNLSDSDGLYASPFRTDDWPGLTTGRR